jgi:hypothetical protein
VEQKAILLELQYLPPIQYFAKFFQYSTIFLEQHENYSKRSYRNRCHIAMADGIRRLSIPLKKGKNEQQSIRKVQIVYEENWQKIHWSSIVSAYNNAPFFEHYEFLFQPFYTKQFEFLFDFNFELLKTVLQILDLTEPPKLTDSFQKETFEGLKDFRNQINPQRFVDTEDPDFSPLKYSQVFEEKNGFIPNLSILDLIFCTGPQASYYLENSITN